MAPTSSRSPLRTSTRRRSYNESVKANLARARRSSSSTASTSATTTSSRPQGMDVVMVAPKGPGHVVRREYVDGRGVPVLVASSRMHPVRRGTTALAYAKAIGGPAPASSRRPSRKRPRPTSSVSRQSSAAVPSHLVQYGFEVLTEAGYQPEIAYFEVLHELKLIVDLIVEGGLTKQRWSCSDTAEYGDYVSGPHVITPEVKENMKAVLDDIQTGAFAEALHGRPGRGRSGVQGAPRQGGEAPDRGDRPRAAPDVRMAQGLGRRLRRGHRSTLIAEALSGSQR